MRNKTSIVIRKMGLLRGKRKELSLYDHCSRKECWEVSIIPTDLKKVQR